MDDNRRQRSDTMELLLEANVTLYPSGGRPMEGTLEDVSAGEVTVLLMDDRRPPLARNQRVRLQIQLRKLEKPMNIVGTLMEQRKDGDRTHCVFRFTHIATVDKTLPPDIYAVFNRRQMFRVRPDPKHPIKATLKSLEDDEQQLEALARVTDISGSGVGLLVEAKEAAPFNLRGQLNLELCLPGEDDAITFRARMCYRIEVGNRWRYGIEFDPRRSKGFRGQQHRLMRFIMNRQRDLLKLPTGRWTPA